MPLWFRTEAYIAGNQHINHLAGYSNLVAHCYGGLALYSTETKHRSMIIQLISSMLRSK